MSDLHIPWLELAILVPILSGTLVSFCRDADNARRWSLVATAITFVLTQGEYLDFQFINSHEADDPGHLLSWLLGTEVFVVDEISAPLLAVAAMLFALTALATPRSKIRRFSFSWMLFSEALMLATFSCKQTWIVIGLLAAGTLRPYSELRDRGRPIGVYVFHMAAYVGCLVLGQALVEWENGRADENAHVHSLWALLPLLIAVLIRSGVAPFHCWITDLFEHTTFGTALLFVTPLTGAYVAVRILLPAANDNVLHWMGVLSLITAVYAGGMALVQQEGRRFFCYLFLSHSALVLVGLEMVTPVGLTGALSLWLSLSLSLGGFGLTLRALEARRGRLSLGSFQGLYEHSPVLGICFALTGLASVGFPGTLGFVGSELLVDGAVELYSPWIGAAVVCASALNGIAIVKAYFLLFTGTRYASTISLAASRRERFAVFCVAGLLVAGGLIPQYNVAARFKAAAKVLEDRHDTGRDKPESTQDLLGASPAAPAEAAVSATEQP
jgi:NADH-quinone oxidoreductase subunit M